jgi:recombination protein RecT
VIGYVSIFALTNGFEHELYMSRPEMEAHANRYSQAYRYDKSKNIKSSPWSTDFDTMGLKTVNKLNLSKYGLMSIEIEKALVTDQAVLRGDEATPEYVDGTDLLDNEKASDDQKDAIVAAVGGDIEDDFLPADPDKKDAEKEASTEFAGGDSDNGSRSRARKR